MTIDNSTVNDNTNNNAGADDLDGFGGGIYQADEDSLMTITNSEVNRNTAQGRGGGIYITNGHMVIDHSEVNDNTLDGPRDGGGIFSAARSRPAGGSDHRLDGRPQHDRTERWRLLRQHEHQPRLVVHQQSTFNDNDAAANGGGLHTRMFATIANSTIDNNHAGAEGGGIWLIDKDLSLYNVTVSDNDAGTWATGFAATRRRERRRLLPQQHDRRQQRLQRRSERQQPDHGGVQQRHEQPRQRDELWLRLGQRQPSSAIPSSGRYRTTAGRRSRAPSAARSDALDAGDDPTCAAAPVDGIDQRHVPRPQGTACDIGAYERAATVGGMKFKDLDTVGVKDTG